MGTRVKVVVWPADHSGCGMYRLQFPADALAAQGEDVVVTRRGPDIAWDKDWSAHEDPPAWVRLMGISGTYEADVVVMQRPGRRWWSDLIPHLHAQGTRVVVDVDDLFDSIPKANVAYTKYLDAVNHHEWIDKACQLADVVTCTTPALLARYGYGKGVILPNLVPESYLSIYGLKLRETVGWGGWIGSHPGDLASTGGAIAQALAGTDWRFHVIGDGVKVAEELHLPSSKLDIDGFADFTDYATAVAQFEIGVVPLADSRFNRAKSALKASELAAVGVPVVMSPTPDNLRLHRLGVGLVADSRGKWQRLLKKLMSDDALRYDLAERGREVMRGQTYELHAWRWLEAWTEKVKVAA